MGKKLPKVSHYIGQKLKIRRFSIQQLKRKMTEKGPSSEKEKNGQRKEGFPIHKETIRERGTFPTQQG
jgi:hypothetical protein